jgi:hypothetical protein
MFGGYLNFEGCKVLPYEKSILHLNRNCHTKTAFYQGRFFPRQFSESLPLVATGDENLRFSYFPFSSLRTALDKKLGGFLVFAIIQTVIFYADKEGRQANGKNLCAVRARDDREEC